MSSEIRLRKKKTGVVKAVEELDAFPKVREECLRSTPYGGTASLIAVFVSLWLIALETSYFLDTTYQFRFAPDNDVDTKMTINVDITVAMPCSLVGADIVDSTSQSLSKFGELDEEYDYFKLSPAQKSYFDEKRFLNSYLGEQYHSLQHLLWKSDFINIYSEMPKLTREEKFKRGVADACRLYGSLSLNKVSGNFHITAGKTLSYPSGHAHIAAFMDDRDYNFSHRIHKLSFGKGMPAIIHPLEGDEKIAKSNHMIYQYFIQIVPTVIKNLFSTYYTYQYSVREFNREIDHGKGSHGISGIFLKYEMSGFKVEVSEQSYPFWKFIIRLCAVVGGVFATVGMVYSHFYTWICECSGRSRGSEDKQQSAFLLVNDNQEKNGAFSLDVNNIPVTIGLPDILASHPAQ